MPPSRPRPRSPALSGLWVLQLRAQLALPGHSWACGWPGGAAKPPSAPHSGVGPQQGLVCALLLLFHLQQPAHPEVSRAGSRGSGAEVGGDLQGVPLPPPGARRGLGLESACHGLFSSSDLPWGCSGSRGGPSPEKAGPGTPPGHRGRKSDTALQHSEGHWPLGGKDAPAQGAARSEPEEPDLT